jgi:hypothetical protein
MSQLETRRSFLAGTAAAAAGAGLLHALPEGAAAGNSETAPAERSSPLPAEWPTQPPELAREMVGVAHGNAARVRELLARWPTLARAAWDWGFGDWEDALGAASHVGNREIAELLLAHGARPTLFSAAMLGQLEVVRALVAASPGSQRTAGPHGLTLLHHARAGGAPAAAVVAFLEALGGADLRTAQTPLTEGEQAEILGSYAFGEGADERIEIALGRFGPTLERSGGAKRPLEHLGGLEFHPAGAPAVRIRFERVGGRIVALTVHDPDLVLRAARR